MKISVLIPAYNAAHTIVACIESVLLQTLPAHEVIVLIDGATDETVTLLERFKPQIAVITQANIGVARTRNRLVGLSSGDVLAFLDQDDMWHPRYLELQAEILTNHPTAAGSIIRHYPFHEDAQIKWADKPEDLSPFVEFIQPLDFFQTYNQSSIRFLPSFFCVPKKIILGMGIEPFPHGLDGADDFYIFNALALHGPVVFFSKPFGAYRLTQGSQSSNRLVSIAGALRAFDYLAERTDIKLRKDFSTRFYFYNASLRRKYAKYLMGAGMIGEARDQIVKSLKAPRSTLTLFKSLALYLTTWLPKPMQPQWPAPQRS